MTGFSSAFLSLAPKENENSGLLSSLGVCEREKEKGLSGWTKEKLVGASGALDSSFDCSSALNTIPEDTHSGSFSSFFSGTDGRMGAVPNEKELATGLSPSSFLEAGVVLKENEMASALTSSPFPSGLLVTGLLVPNEKEKGFEDEGSSSFPAAGLVAPKEKVAEGLLSAAGLVAPKEKVAGGLLSVAGLVAPKEKVLAGSLLSAAGLVAPNEKGKGVVDVGSSSFSTVAGLVAPKEKVLAGALLSAFAPNAKLKGVEEGDLLSSAFSATLLVPKAKAGTAALLSSSSLLADLVAPKVKEKGAAGISASFVPAAVLVPKEKTGDETAAGGILSSSFLPKVPSEKLNGEVFSSSLLLFAPKATEKDSVVGLPAGISGSALFFGSSLSLSLDLPKPAKEKAAGGVSGDFCSSFSADLPVPKEKGSLKGVEEVVSSFPLPITLPVANEKEGATGEVLSESFLPKFPKKRGGTGSRAGDFDSSLFSSLLPKVKGAMGLEASSPCAPKREGDWLRSCSFSLFELKENPAGKGYWVAGVGLSVWRFEGSV